MSGSGYYVGLRVGEREKIVELCSSYVLFVGCLSLVSFPNKRPREGKELRPRVI